LHPAAESLEAYAEGVISPPDRAVVESHLLGCPRCDGVVDEWRSLFQALSTLPRFTPSAGFAERVLTLVRIPEPWHARAAASVARWLPRSTRGWALAAAFLALPIVTGGMFMTWLLSKSYVTTHGLWVFVTDRFATAIESLLTGILTFLMQTDVAAWAARSAGTILETGGARGFGALAGGIALLIVICAWVLYTNLLRTPDRDSNYVTYSF
jgi:predicted anti-sigma-YlaC factor YlaD